MDHKRTYKKQLLIYFAGVFTLFAVLIVLFQLSSERRYKEEILQSRLSVYSDIIAQASDYGQIMSLLPNELRVTVIGKDGTVLFDSRADVDSLDNHLMRPEVQESILRSEGLAIRKSDTTGMPYFYFSKSYGGFVVRVALPYEVDIRRFFQPDTLFLILVISLFVVALFSLIFLSDHFGEGISRLHSFAEAAEKGAVDYDSITFPDSELGAIGEKMLESYRRLERSNRMIALEKERLLLHIHYYEGGIAIFSPGREKLYANYRFIQFMNTLLERPTPDINDMWSSKMFSPLCEFLDRSTPVKTDYPPVFRFKLSKGARNYDIQMLIYPDNGFEITINDVTEIEKSRTMKQQMTNNIAHELRTPVSSIRGYLETLISCPDVSEERRKVFIDRAYVQTLRLSDLIRDIALITKIEEAPEQLQKEKVNIRQIVDEVIEEFREVIDSKDITVENMLSSDLVVTGNATLIYSIFRNLVENSLKYAGDGVLIHIECYARSDGHYHFTYYDTGKGIGEEHLSRIFERFYRVSEGRTRDGGGSGLGLSIVRNAVAFHGGDIRAVNRAGGGLEFVFSLKIQ
ncbi:MAG: two-component sensor histidine kinase [Bacteroidetes bacterium]|uniref:histidine kinase n=1 Tax=Candidatus Cryptobacteroides intestinigallinarum TaxID=2840767 RepID=A0A9D9MY03_9BACT|nr:two-component sensor histidine kinase [Candidatus Cryptobacteroides intestinigallinarum]